MSGKENVEKKAIEVAEAAVTPAPKSPVKEIEGPVVTKAQFAKQQQQEAQRRKQATNELNSYKKRVRESNELKELQVRELELNIAYYKNKKEWFDLIPKVEELDAQEQAMMKKQQEEMQAKAAEASKKDQEERDGKQDVPKIIVANQGKARE